MKIYEEYEVNVKRQKLIKCLCDRCGDEIPKPDRFDTRDVDIEWSTGSSYPEGGYKEGFRVEDVCDDCLEVFLALLKDNGFNVTKVDESW